MKDGKFWTCPVFAILAAMIITLSFISGTAVASEGTLTVTVEVFSGRQNPSFEITDPALIDRVRQGLKGLPSMAITEEQGYEFGRLGYRGIIITHSGDIEGVPRYVQFLRGKVKVLGADSASFFQDTRKFERHYLGVAKTKGLITELLDAQIVPDPDSM